MRSFLPTCSHYISSISSHCIRSSASINTGSKLHGNSTTLPSSSRCIPPTSSQNISPSCSRCISSIAVRTRELCFNRTLVQTVQGTEGRSPLQESLHSPNQQSKHFFNLRSLRSVSKQSEHENLCFNRKHWFTLARKQPGVGAIPPTCSQSVSFNLHRNTWFTLSHLHFFTKQRFCKQKRCLNTCFPNKQ